MPIINLIYNAPEQRREPWANTIAYYPLNSTTTNTDQSWHWNTLTNQWAVFWTYGGVNCANTTGKSLYWGITNLPTWNSARTISVWANAQASSSWMAIYWYGNNSTHKRCVAYRTTSSWWAIYFSHYNDDIVTSVAMNTNKWYLLTYTYDGTTAKWYINWALAWSVSISLNTASSNLVISWWGAGNETFTGYISEFILENKARTADEISKYYNWTKANYWL